MNQCDNCVRNGLRECRYHGYPEDTIPESCAYKIGNSALRTVTAYDVPVMRIKAGEQQMHRVKCKNCGHKLIKKGGDWIHIEPHPDHVCRCIKPEPWKRDTSARVIVKIPMGGVTTYSGMMQREVDYQVDY